MAMKELEDFINPIMQNLVQEGGGEYMNEQPPMQPVPEESTNDIPIEEID